MHAAIAPDLLPIVSLGVLELAGIVNVEGDERLEGPLAEAEAKARRDPPAVRAAVRAMYWQVGIDPTRRRPSSEALLRRVLRGDRLPRINTLVDICNWCSLEFQLPFGLYDLERVDGGVSLRLGQPGEEYAGIGKDVVHVAGRLALADRSGPFGNPTSDSRRTMVTAATTRALVVIFAPRALPVDIVQSALKATADRAAIFTGAREAARSVV
jgi:DNA/RNA-binding domain of Phe-tRNA-synthetase-like protein